MPILCRGALLWGAACYRHSMALGDPRVDSARAETASRAGELESAALSAPIHISCPCFTQISAELSRYAFTIGQARGVHFAGSRGWSAPCVFSEVERERQRHDHLRAEFLVPAPVLGGGPWPTLPRQLPELAEAIEVHGLFDGMPVLGDALEEAGVADGLVLAHCRSKTVTHRVGCWVLAMVRLCHLLAHPASSPPGGTRTWQTPTG